MFLKYNEKDRRKNVCIKTLLYKKKGSKDQVAAENIDFTNK